MCGLCERCMNPSKLAIKFLYVLVMCLPLCIKKTLLRSMYYYYYYHSLTKVMLRI